MLTRIISGGQTGADRGALIAARAAGLQTGGWMPLGFLAHDGRHPEFADLYGMQETESAGYPDRTERNVRESDATLRIYREADSPGEKCTLRLLRLYAKEHVDVLWLSTGTHVFYSDAAIVWATSISHWLELNKVRTLNVAGNSERTCPGIQVFAERFMARLLRAVRVSEEARG